MSDEIRVSVPLNAKSAQGILLSIAATESTYNRGWKWWAHDVSVNAVFQYGNARVVKIQESLGDPDTVGYNTVETEMIWRIEVDNTLTGGEDEKYFQLRGEYSSYDGDDWHNTVKEVRPTQKVVRIFEVAP
jgi:hypothetical protein